MNPITQIAIGFLKFTLRSLLLSNLCVKSMRSILCFCAFAAMLSFSAFSQTVEITKSTRIEKIEGKDYYIHKIIKGQTLYSISKAYNVLISEIVFENPEAIDGIKPDMELKIPVKAGTSVTGAVKDKPVEINGKYRIHVVEKGQTMYAVSRMYNMSVFDILKANPGIDENLSLGQKLNIPVEQLMKAQETIYTSANLNSMDDTTTLVIDTGRINVVLLLPLYLDENESSRHDTSGGSNRESIYSKSLNGLEFYEGAKLAVDSLTKKGIKTTVYAFDIPDDEALAAILNKPVLKKADIIIGPFHGKRFETVAAFAKENNIACISPVLKRSDAVQSNAFVSKVLPSDEVQIHQLGDFIGRWNCKKNIIVLHNSTAEDSVLILKLIQGIKSRCDSAKIHVLNTKGKSIKLVDSLIQPNVENIIMAFSKDESYVSRLVLYLEKKNAKQRVVTLFGLNEWQDFENIEVEYFQNLNLHLPVDLFVDYSRNDVKKFLLKFREKYMAEPGKYSLLGYDVTMYYILMLNKFGKQFYKKPELIHYTGLQSNFDYKKIAEQGGLENQCTFILNYNDYRLVKVN